jgi:hypothetical protein
LPMLAETVNEPAVVPAPMPQSEWMPDWDMESRTDLPVRSPEEIDRLLRFETPEQTAARIWNDKVRHMRSQGVGCAVNPQTAIINADAIHSGITVFERR